MLISMETHITCDFPGGGPDHIPPLWICTCLVSRTHVDPLGRPRDSPSVLKVLPGKFDTKIHSPQVTLSSIV